MDNEKRNALNRRVCRALIQTMNENGWTAVKADDENLRGLTLHEKVEMIFNLDGAEIMFKKTVSVPDSAEIRLKKNVPWHIVVFTPYNTGIECIADWSYGHEGDEFSKLMDAFTDDPKWERAAA